MPDIENILSLSAFNGDLVTTYFSIDKDRPEEYAAMRFMFKMIRDEYSGSKKTDAGQAAANLTIEKIDFRYSLYKGYAEDFFQHHQAPDFKSLCLAVICDEYINNANEPIQQAPGQEDQPMAFRDDGFEEEELIRACCLWEEACTMEGHGIPDKFSPSLEAVFLAHIHAIGNLYELEESMEDYDIDDLIHFRDNDFPCLRDFICPQTEIGKKLEEFLDYMSSRIDNIVAPKLRGFHLKLVSTNPEPGI